MDANYKVQRTIRLLQRAEGYLDLHLPERAISELDSIANAGPFEPAVALLRGEALKSQERYNEALIPLKQAATMIPAPLNKRAWRSLSECYRLTGREELAEVAELVLNAEEVESDAKITVHFAVVPLPLVQEALKLLLGGREVGDATDESPEEDQSTPEE
jgi:tetratricopeptide (TPR) repeat protein